MCFCCVFSWTKRNDTRTAFCVTSPAPPTILNEASSKHELLLAIAELTRSNAELVQKSQALELAHERLRAAYLQALERLELLRRRLFLAKKERLDSAQIQLELDGVQAQVEELERALAQTSNEDTPAPRNEDTPAPPLDPKAKSSKGHGRRNLADAELPETTVEILDPELEGKAERIGFEDHYELSYQRGGMRKVRVRRAKYKVNAVTSEGEPQAAEQEQRSHISVAPAPRVLQQRGFLAASMISHILVMKYAMGVPFYRQETQYALDGFGLDRGTMSRYSEHIGASLGAILEAQRADALAHAFCLATDATGINILPVAREDKASQPCKKGHFFVILADHDYVFMEYEPKHTSAAVSKLFQGFSGYIQADAHVIYDALFRGPSEPTEAELAALPTEVGCWSHARRHFWEAAICKSRKAIEGLRKILEIFALDGKLKGVAPARKKELRQEFVAPAVERFYAWVHATEQEKPPYGRLPQALGYVRRNEAALRRFLEDGRLKPDNNGSERALRQVAIGRKAWLFCGSDDHAQSSGNLLGLIATCRLHGVDAESYLAEVIRAIPYWPRHRYLELSPRFWHATRSRLNPAELERPVGPITVPPPLPSEQ